MLLKKHKHNVLKLSNLNLFDKKFTFEKICNSLQGNLGKKYSEIWQIS
jgi:hypothetical protein